MGRISHSATIATAVEAVAVRQHGVVSREQLRRAGLSDDQIDTWVRAGRISRVSRAVYYVGSAPIGERGRIKAAELASGRGAVVSHRSAAFLLGIGERSPRVVDVIAPRQGGRKVDGIRFHDVVRPGRYELVRVHGIVCTSVARTVVDLAGVYGEDGLRETFERAAAIGVLDLAAIRAVLDGGPKRRGAPCLRRVLEEWRPMAETARYATVRSLFEAKLLPLIGRSGLPMPRINAPVRTAERILEVDLLWPNERFVVEADSRIHHATEVAFERDRKRDLDLMEVH
ncbi:MAG TPA: type IV toxin-antitoxin system AbiEi family antitoxin domain-containing protein [Solirubrobacterales bacterium]|nr:type IV toxin-antitoxin system AbiEi family antitoxin domain-containing protein [Solirubrobacterales bacterium]